MGKKGHTGNGPFERSLSQRGPPKCEKKTGANMKGLNNKDLINGGPNREKRLGRKMPFRVGENRAVQWGIVNKKTKKLRMKMNITDSIERNLSGKYKKEKKTPHLKNRKRRRDRDWTMVKEESGPEY